MATVTVKEAMTVHEAFYLLGKLHISPNDIQIHAEVHAYLAGQGATVYNCACKVT